MWVFAEMPHLIKLLRNYFLDYGIRLPCGTKVSKQHYLKENSPKNNKFQSFLTWLISGLSGSDEEEALRYIAGYLAHCSKNENVMNKKPILNEGKSLETKWKMQVTEDLLYRLKRYLPRSTAKIFNSYHESGLNSKPGVIQTFLYAAYCEIPERNELPRPTKAFCMEQALHSTPCDVTRTEPLSPPLLAHGSALPLPLAPSLPWNNRVCRRRSGHPFCQFPFSLAVGTVMTHFSFNREDPEAEVHRLLAVGAYKCSKRRHVSLEHGLSWLGKRKNFQFICVPPSPCHAPPSYQPFRDDNGERATIQSPPQHLPAGPRPKADRYSKTVAPFELRAGLEIELKFISNRRNWRFEISVRDQQPSSTNCLEDKGIDSLEVSRQYHVIVIPECSPTLCLHLSTQPPKYLHTQHSWWLHFVWLGRTADCKIWAALNIEVLRVEEGEVRNTWVGETGDPRENPPISGIVRQSLFPLSKIPGATPPRLETEGSEKGIKDKLAARTEESTTRTAAHKLLTRSVPPPGKTPLPARLGALALDRDSGGGGGGGAPWFEIQISPPLSNPQTPLQPLVISLRLVLESGALGRPASRRYRIQLPPSLPLPSSVANSVDSPPDLWILVVFFTCGPVKFSIWVLATLLPSAGPHPSNEPQPLTLTISTSPHHASPTTRAHTYTHTHTRFHYSNYALANKHQRGEEKERGMHTWEGESKRGQAPANSSEASVTRIPDKNPKHATVDKA
ncbi:hypothetical protein PR048_024981 [Dryococelus australis]|uniref:Uncharacterized protein n=1 Tax=Dryococelus australis TaxID=614101 RepID=A0ABQ9GQ64_9NEOP|nr:hypothetical protein PR048_024981 [Dryococelus australis]